MQAPPTAPGVPGVPASDREVRARGPEHPSCGGQLLHAQARQGPGLAGPAAPLPRALHAHLRLMAQSGGALVRYHDPKGDPAGQFLQRQGADRQNRAVRGHLQQAQGAIQLERHGGFNPGEAPATLLADLRDGTLEISYG